MMRHCFDHIKTVDDASCSNHFDRALKDNPHIYEYELNEFEQLQLPTVPEYLQKWVHVGKDVTSIYSWNVIFKNHLKNEIGNSRVLSVESAASDGFITCVLMESICAHPTCRISSVFDAESESESVEAEAFRRQYLAPYGNFLSSTINSAISI